MNSFEYTDKKTLEAAKKNGLEDWLKEAADIPMIKFEYSKFEYKGQTAALIKTIEYPLAVSAKQFADRLDEEQSLSMRKTVKSVFFQIEKKAMIELAKKQKLEYIAMVPGRDELCNRLRMTPVNDIPRGMKYWVVRPERLNSLEESTFLEYATDKLKMFNKDTVSPQDLKNMLRPLEQTKSVKMVKALYSALENKEATKKRIMELVDDIGNKGNKIAKDEWNQEYAEYNPFKEKQKIASFAFSGKTKEKLLEKLPAVFMEEYANKFLSSSSHLGNKNEIGHIRYYPEVTLRDKKALFINEIQSDFQLDMMKIIHNYKRFIELMDKGEVKKAYDYNNDKLQKLQGLLDNPINSKELVLDTSKYELTDGRLFFNQRNNIVRYGNKKVYEKGIYDLADRITADNKKIKLFYQNAQQLKKDKIKLSEIIKVVDDFVSNWHYEALEELAKKSNQEYIAISNTFHKDSNPKNDAPVQYQRYYIKTAKDTDMEEETIGNTSYWIVEKDKFLQKSKNLHEGLLLETNFYEQSIKALRQADNKVSPKELKKLMKDVVNGRMKQKLFREVNNKTIFKKDLKDKIREIGLKENELTEPEVYKFGYSQLEHHPQHSVVYKFSEKALKDALNDPDAKISWKEWLNSEAEVAQKDEKHPRKSNYIGHLRYHTEFEYQGEPAIWIQEIQSDLINDAVKSYSGDDIKEFVKWIKSHTQDWYTYAIEILLKKAKSEGTKYLIITDEFHEDSQPSEEAIKAIYKSLAKKLDMKNVTLESQLMNPDDIEPGFEIEEFEKQREEILLKRKEQMNVSDVEWALENDELKQQFNEDFQDNFTNLVGNGPAFGFVPTENLDEVVDATWGVFFESANKFLYKDMTLRIYLGVESVEGIRELSQNWDRFVSYKKETNNVKYDIDRYSFYEFMSSMFDATADWEDYMDEHPEFDWSETIPEADESQFEFWVNETFSRDELKSMQRQWILETYPMPEFEEEYRQKWIPKSKVWVKEIDSKLIDKIKSLHESTE